VDKGGIGKYFVNGQHGVRDAMDDAVRRVQDDGERIACAWDAQREEYGIEGHQRKVIRPFANTAVGGEE
jgi:hypothetical protein